MTYERDDDISIIVFIILFLIGFLGCAAIGYGLALGLMNAA